MDTLGITRSAACSWACTCGAILMVLLHSSSLGEIRMRGFDTSRIWAMKRRYDRRWMRYRFPAPCSAAGGEMGCPSART